MSVSDTLLHCGQQKCAISQDAPTLRARMLITNSCISISGRMVVLQDQFTFP